jgi:hypothetical protein
MADQPTASRLSIEGRANLIADVVNRIEFAGNPKARQDAVRDEAIKQLRALRQELTGDDFYADTEVAKR